jgi:hypothetical protein
MSSMQMDGRFGSGVLTHEMRFPSRELLSRVQRKHIIEERFKWSANSTGGCMERWFVAMVLSITLVGSIAVSPNLSPTKLHSQRGALL